MTLAAALSPAFATPLVGQLGEDALEGYRSFRAFKRVYGAAGEFAEWHHIVEQTPGNIARFGPGAIHDAENLVRVPRDIHWQISGEYSSKPLNLGGQTVRQWLASQSFEAQRDYGLQVLKRYGIIP